MGVAMMAGRAKFIRRAGIAFAATAALTATTIAFADTHQHVLLKEDLFGNIPNVTIRGVAAGAAPWVVDGWVKLTNDHLMASGKWLIIPKTGYLANGKPIPAAIAGTTAHVPEVLAEVTFANSPAIVTAPVKLSSDGDFTINANIQVPAGASQPIVLIGPGADGKMKAWFASTNFLFNYGVATKASVMGSTKGMGGSKSW
ncbi:MAG: hypothetical protein OWQ59_06355 [Alicyclobacillaceae bacterium]|nr:hypothetical protein [Alicyclobacillaceae bacterium]MCY0895649.1 hypothetical protein [Alicyclobacillaceae bacterium]